jgi:hypothetical protein
MDYMTKDEAACLDELFTKTTPKVDTIHLGVFARQKKWLSHWTASLQGIWKQEC